jgi:hypothetical protein
MFDPSFPTDGERAQALHTACFAFNAAISKAALAGLEVRIHQETDLALGRVPIPHVYIDVLRPITSAEQDTVVRRGGKILA